VIIIGRGANIITARLDSVFHVRLVAPLEMRIRRIQENDGLDRKAALEFVQREDRGRKRYLRKHYQKDINDPLLYHLVINTELMGYEKAAQLVGDVVMEKRAHRENPDARIQTPEKTQIPSFK
jgi:cytidylate kinase